MTTRRIVADKMATYLHRRISATELVDWAETQMVEGEFEEAHSILPVLQVPRGNIGFAFVGQHVSAASSSPSSRPPKDAERTRGERPASLRRG